MTKTLRLHFQLTISNSFKPPVKAVKIHFIKKLVQFTRTSYWVNKISVAKLRITFRLFFASSTSYWENIRSEGRNPRANVVVISGKNQLLCRVLSLMAVLFLIICVNLMGE